jgi:hypothetical protein
LKTSKLVSRLKTPKIDHGAVLIAPVVGNSPLVYSADFGVSVETVLVFLGCDAGA